MSSSYLTNFILLLLIFKSTLGIDLASAKNIERKGYYYPEKNYSAAESLMHIGKVYALSIAVYSATQYDTIRTEGHLKRYKQNIGRVHFDTDEDIWNLYAHTASGSQMYLFYRANGYPRKKSVFMTFISSTLFEFTIETYTEAASWQDIYQTPVLGSTVGYLIEIASMKLLNHGTPVSKFLGHLINPFTLFNFYKGGSGHASKIIPTIDDNKVVGITVQVDF